MNEATRQEIPSVAKIISTRLIETLIIASVVLYGVVKVLETQTEAIIKTQERMIEKIEAFGSEQSRRTVMVEESYKKSHTHIKR